MSRNARFCASCTPGFKNFLRKIYKRDVLTSKTASFTGGRIAIGRQSRRRTLDALRNNGPMSTPELARLVEMTPEGVRVQLKRLGVDGLVDCVHEGRSHVWTANETD